MKNVKSKSKKLFLMGMIVLFSVSSVTSIDICLGSWWETMIPKKLPVNVGYIKSNGEIEPSNLPIAHIGNTYFLTSNLANYSINIQKDGIIFDGNGYTLSFPAYGEKDENKNTKTTPGLFEITNRTNITIKNTELQKCTKAVSVDNASKVCVIQNSMKNGGFPVLVVDSFEISIIQNSMIKTSGIRLRDSYNCSILNNFINSTSSGFYAIDSIFELKNNTFINYNGPSQAVHGISGAFKNSSIVGNYFSGYSCAIYQIDSYNRVIGNTFEKNRMGILNNGPALAVEKIEVYHNNFINNQDDDFDVWYGSNILDDGTRGNYWDKYNGTDKDGDGIGDTPKIIETVTSWNNETNIDNYPLMSPTDIVVPESPFEVHHVFEESTFHMHDGSGVFYPVTVVSNSTVSDFDFLYDLMQISFHVNGTTGTTGLCSVSIPSEFMSTEFSIFKDEKLLLKNTDYTQTFNGTHYLFTITYDHSSHLIQIYANNNIPEFSSGFIFVFVAVASLIVVAARKNWRRVT